MTWFLEELLPEFSALLAVEFNRLLIVEGLLQERNRFKLFSLLEKFA